MPSMSTKLDTDSKQIIWTSNKLRLLIKLQLRGFTMKLIQSERFNSFQNA